MAASAAARNRGVVEPASTVRAVSLGQVGGPRAATASARSAQGTGGVLGDLPDVVRAGRGEAGQGADGSPSDRSGDLPVPGEALQCRPRLHAGPAEGGGGRGSNEHGLLFVGGHALEVPPHGRSLRREQNHGQLSRGRIGIGEEGQDGVEVRAVEAHGLDRFGEAGLDQRLVVLGELVEELVELPAIGQAADGGLACVGIVGGEIGEVVLRQRRARDEHSGREPEGQEQGQKEPSTDLGHLLPSLGVLRRHLDDDACASGKTRARCGLHAGGGERERERERRRSAPRRLVARLASLPRRPRTHERGRVSSDRLRSIAAHAHSRSPGENG